MLSLLQAARFVAAALVLCRHGELVFGLTKYYDYHPLGGLFNGGNLGVDFFFVLSGFIICHAHWNDIGHPTRLLEYLRRRATRIYPSYWVAFILLLIPFYFMHSRFDDLIWSPVYLVRQFLLLPTADGFVEVNWTLQHEVMFYAMFAILIANRTAGLVALGLWFIASATITGSATVSTDVLRDPRHIQFLLGMAAAFVTRYHAVPSPRSILALGIGTFLACLYVGGLGYGDLAVPGAPNLTLAVGLAAALIVISLVELERSHAWRAPAVLRTLGDASYALYLIHLPVLTLFVRVVHAKHLEAVVPIQVLFACGLLAGLASGVVFYYAVERPIQSALRRRTGRKVPHLGGAAVVPPVSSA
jgi:exopolysaccharide production protein ExoZ